MDNIITNEAVADSVENTVVEAEEPVELTELFVSERKTVTLSDTITLQAIICVAVSIAYVAANMLCPDISQGLYKEFMLNYNAQSESAEGVFKAVSDFLYSTPVSYD